VQKRGSKREVFTDHDRSTSVITRTRQDDETLFVTGEFEYVFFKGLTGTIGISYGDFDFDRAMTTNRAVTDQLPPSLLASHIGERFITRTYFAEADWKINKTGYQNYLSMRAFVQTLITHILAN